MYCVDEVGQDFILFGLAIERFIDLLSCGEDTDACAEEGECGRCDANCLRHFAYLNRAFVYPIILALVKARFKLVGDRKIIKGSVGTDTARPASLMFLD